MFYKTCYFYHAMDNSLCSSRIHTSIGFYSSLTESHVRETLETISANSPFALRHLASSAPNDWVAEFTQCDMDMHLRFAKSVELHLQIARRFEVHTTAFNSEVGNEKGTKWLAMQ